MVSEHIWRCPGTATPAIENDIIGTRIKGKLNIIFNMVGSQLEANRNAAGYLSDAI
jgi:hypothetical protein